MNEFTLVNLAHISLSMYALVKNIWNRQSLFLTSSSIWQAHILCTFTNVNMRKYELRLWGHELR